jgi:molybdopterin molybdotransferase
MNHPIDVNLASAIIMEQQIPLAAPQLVPLERALGRVLAENLVADRHFPPFDRVTMDGIAINFASYLAGNRVFSVEGLQAAGDVAGALQRSDACIEVMTGSVLPLGTNTVVRYEDIKDENGGFRVLSDILPNQNVHCKGSDAKKDDTLVAIGETINAGVMAVAATVGKAGLWVVPQPRVLIITSGNEIVEINAIPLSHQIRGSNFYALQGLLATLQIIPDKMHISDDHEATSSAIAEAISKYQVVILSGGVSMGKKDFIPQALYEGGVEKLFHKIAQKPGKPMWFGRTATCVIFGLPGNPVSTFLCGVRYLMPWLRQVLNGKPNTPAKAFLGIDVPFKPALTYFLQVKLKNESGRLVAYPVAHNGSGDFLNLSEANAFIELPAKTSGLFKKGEVVDVYAF